MMLHPSHRLGSPISGKSWDVRFTVNSTRTGFNGESVMSLQIGSASFAGPYKRGRSVSFCRGGFYFGTKVQAGSAVGGRASVYDILELLGRVSL